MKTIILILALIPSVALGQKADTTELTKEKIYNDVKNAVTQLSSVLEVGAEHVYEVLVAQQRVESITWIIVDSVLVVGMVIFFSTVYLFRKEIDDDDAVPMMVGFGIIGSTVTIVTVLFTVNTIVTGLINPEYGAIHEILKVLK